MGKNSDINSGSEIQQTGSNVKNIFSVAYKAGPENIEFLNRHWQRGKAQPVSAEEWAAMQERADFNEFKFTEEN